MRRWPWYSLVVMATRRSVTSRTGSPGTSEAVWPSGPRPRWTRSRRSGSEVSYSGAASSRSRWVLDREAERHVGEGAVVGAGRGDPLVDLEELGLPPGHLLEVAEDRQHRP